MSQLILQPGSSGIDSYIELTQPTVNFGSEMYLYFGVQIFGKSTFYFRSLLLFDISAIPVTATIDSAELDLQNEGGSLPGSSTFRCYRCTRTNWTELGVTFNKYDGTNDWTAAGGDYTTTDGDSVVKTAVSDVLFTNLAPLVSDALVNRSGLLSLLLRGDDESGADDRYLASRSSDHGTADQRPKLTINYTLAASGVAAPITWLL